MEKELHQYSPTSDAALVINKDKDEKSHTDHVLHFNRGTNDGSRETDILDVKDNHIRTDLVSHPKETGHELPVSIPESCKYSIQRQDAKNGVYHVGMTVTTSMHQTRKWVTQEPLLPTDSDIYTQSDGFGVKSGIESGMSESKLTGGSSEVKVVESETVKDDEFSSLALDIDESIEQLNQLILDLDPEFEPVPTIARCHKTSPGSLHRNGLTARSKPTHLDWRNDQVPGVFSQPSFKRPDADFLQTLSKPSTYISSQLGDPYGKDTVDYGEFSLETNRYLWVDLNQPPSTPAFPVTPPTPYMKIGYDFSSLTLSNQMSPQHLFSRTQQESRGYMDNMKHSPVSSDEHLFHSEVTLGPSSCQRGFGSMRSVNTSSPLPNTHSPLLTRSWMENGSTTTFSHYTPQPSPPLSLPTPNARSSSRTLPSTLSVGSMELSLLEAMEGLESLSLNGIQPPNLPQKMKGLDEGELPLNSPFNCSGAGASFSCNSGSPTASTPSPDLYNKPDNVKFVQDTSKFWYKPDISRDQAITVLKDKEPGAFIVRDSHSFRGAYGLAMKVATPPPTTLHQSKKVCDLTSELVRHFLIECTQKGVRLKGCPTEPYFGSLTALVCQHSITPLALPCKLIIPDRDPLEELTDAQGQTSSNSAFELLKQGAACNVWFLGSVELESLTGVQAVQKAATVILGQESPNTSTIVHFKVSAQGITLTDNQRKLFFRRHYAVSTVIYCALDPQDRKWLRDGCLAAKIFGFVARKSGSSNENVCHLFAEHDPEQPASAIVNFVSKVMIGSQKVK